MDKFIWPVRIYYEDTDAGGVVYHTNYLKFMERARAEWLRALGFEQDILKAQEKILFAVRKLRIDYHKPATFNELLNITTRLGSKRRASFICEQAILNQEKKIICQAIITIVCIDSDAMQVKPIPEKILKVLN